MTLTNIKSALVSSGLMAVLSVLTYVAQSGSIFTLDWRSLANIAVLSFLTGVVSIFKNAMTSPQGTFGGIQVK